MYLAAAALGNKVFFAGGLNAFISPAVSSTVEIYNLSNNTWSQANLSKARLNISAIPLGNKIYFAGGEIEPFGSSSRIDIYDQTNASWTTSELLENKTGIAGIAYGGKIYCAGGANFQFNSNNTRNVEIIDVNNGYTSISCLTHPVDWSYISQGAVLKNDKLVFLNGNSAYPNQFDIYNISDNTWTTGILPFPIINGVVISVNNVIYVAGGYVNGQLSNKVYKLEF